MSGSVQVRFFAQLRVATGVGELELHDVAGLSVRALAEQLERRFPDLVLKGSMCAVNEAYADPSTVLQGGEIVAFLPPVSGG